jgi:acetylornithine deacetylase
VNAEHVRSARDAVEAAFPETVEFLRELVQAQSLLGNEEPAQQLVERRLKRLGFVVRSVELAADNVARHSESGIPLILDGDRRSLVGRLAGAIDMTVALNGHVDVVSAEPLDDWTRPPFEGVVEAGRMYGRGAGDMKGGVAAMMLAVEAARAVGPTPSLVFQSVIEEECTGNGTLAACLAEPDFHAAVVGEPTEGLIRLAAPGIIWARIILVAPAGHAGSSDERPNPIETAFAVIRSLRELEDELNARREPEFEAFSKPYLLNVGALHAGDWPATSPGRAVLDVRLGFPIALPPQRAQEQLKTAVHRAAPDAEVEFRGFRARGYSLDPKNTVVRLLRECHADVHGFDPELAATRATSDLRYFQPPVGSGAAAMYGPTGGGYHGADEWVDLESIMDVATVLALFLLRFR